MKQWQRIISVCAAMAGLGLLAPAASAQASSAGGAKDLVLNGDAKCTVCHNESSTPELLAIGKTKHGTRADSRTPTCTSCHGASEKHRSGGGKPDVTFGKKSVTTAESSNDVCLTCHQGGNRITWKSSTHAARDVVCSNCHQIHKATDPVRDKAEQTETCYTCHKEQRAQMSRPSHHPVPEGKMTCSSCHNVHGDNPKQLIKASTNDTCYTCHMEKRGPFVHNHEPVAEDCGICHQPHGTVVENLLRSRAPFLCQECHSHRSHPSQSPGLPTSATNSTSLVGSIGRACMNCHTNIHGGNSTQNSATAGRFRR